MINFTDVLAIILLVRSLLIILLSFFIVKTNLKVRRIFIFRYCESMGSNPWTYRLWGLSALWLIIQYKDLLRSLI